MSVGGSGVGGSQPAPAIDRIWDLLAIIADPQKAKKRLVEIEERESAVRDKEHAAANAARDAAQKLTEASAKLKEIEEAETELRERLRETDARFKALALAEDNARTRASEAEKMLKDAQNWAASKTAELVSRETICSKREESTKTIKAEAERLHAEVATKALRIKELAG